MTPRSDPLVSILVPAYNAEATLAETLQSALASSYSRLEIVLVDDGSTDATATIAETFARQDERVRFSDSRTAECRPPSTSVSCKFAESSWLGSISDDLWHPTKLERQVELLATDSTVALAYTFVRYVDDTGRIVRDAAPQRLAGRALCQCLCNGIIGGGSSVVFRRSILDSVGGYDEGLRVWEDLLVHVRVAAAGAIAFVPEYLTGYRLRRIRRPQISGSPSKAGGARGTASKPNSRSYRRSSINGATLDGCLSWRKDSHSINAMQQAQCSSPRPSLATRCERPHSWRIDCTAGSVAIAARSDGAARFSPTPA